MINETKQDRERRERLHEWFKSDPEIWNDIDEEIRISLHNEEMKLKMRAAPSREWSAGYVCSHEFVLDMKRYFKKIWEPTIKETSTQQGQI